MPKATFRVAARMATEDDVGCVDVVAVHRYPKKRRPSVRSSRTSTASLPPEPIRLASVQSLAEARAIYTEAGGTLDEYGDWSLQRFLRLADPKQAAKQMRKTAAWRAKVGADEIRRKVREGMQPWEWPKCSELAPFVTFLQTELETSLGDAMVWLSFESVFEAAGFIAAVSEAEWLNFSIHVLEHALFHADRLSAERGKLVRWSVVADTQGLGPRNVTFPLLLRVKPTMPLSDNCEYYCPRVNP